MNLSADERQAAARAQGLFSRTRQIYDFFFLRILNYGRAVRAFLEQEVVLKPGDRVLDAGCGTGLLTRALYEQALLQDIDDVAFHAFDLTPKMLSPLKDWAERTGAASVETALFNVLDPAARPEGWGDYDRIISSAMMEYLPRASLPGALAGLKSLLKPGGSLLLIITRRTLLTGFMVGTLWRSELYKRRELSQIIAQAGFKTLEFRDFPGKYKGFGRSVIIVEMS